MTDAPVLEAYLDASARLAGLKLSEASRPIVLENLQLLFAMAAQFEDAITDPAPGPAPVFTPSRP